MADNDSKTEMIAEKPVDEHAPVTNTRTHIIVSSGPSAPYTPSLRSEIETVSFTDAVDLPDLSCHFIQCFNVFEYEDIEKAAKLVDKIKTGGVLHASGVEAIDVTEKMARGEISINEASLLLCQGRLRMNSCKGVAENLTRLGMTILFAGITNNHYLVEARK